MSGRYTIARSRSSGEMNDIRWRHSRGPVQVGEVERDHVGARREQDPELLDAGVVRSVAASDEQRGGVEPEHVAALRRGGVAEPAGDRNAAVSRSAANASGSPRRPSLPGRSRIAPVSVMSAGS